MTSLSVKAIDHMVLNVNDVEISAEWYSKVLGMKQERIEKKNVLSFGKQMIKLRPKDTTQEEWFTAKRVATGNSDLCFLVETPPELIVEHLKSHGVEVEVGPVIKEGAVGNIQSVYCRDPDGSLIEISSYP